MKQQIIEIDGLRTTVVGAPDAPGTAIVLLHGFAMSSADLAPFAHSLGTNALFLFPEGPLPGDPNGSAWFPMDHQARAARQSGPRDLADVSPPGLVTARNRLRSFLKAATAKFQPRTVVLGGFSQGGMMACDAVLHDAVVVSGLLLLSSSRLDLKVWHEKRDRLKALPVLISHGERDGDLAFAAGLGLKDFAEAAGAVVTWVPFDSGHEIPLVVWRAIRRFLRPLTER